MSETPRSTYSGASELAPGGGTTLGRCPVVHHAAQPREPSPNDHWWPQRLDLTLLSRRSAAAVPRSDFDYATAFESLDLAAVKKDIAENLTTSHDWWPADFGTYGPLLLRMVWHLAATYRIDDGRGGAGSAQEKFTLLSPDLNAGNLDQARRLLWPVKRKYGERISWADLTVLTSNVALETMGCKTFGFGGGRVDVWSSDDAYQVTEHELEERELQSPWAAVQPGVIDVRAKDENGDPDLVAAAEAVRAAFKRLEMTDEETVALIVGIRTYGTIYQAGPDPDAPEGSDGLSLRHPVPQDFLCLLLDHKWVPVPDTDDDWQPCDECDSSSGLEATLHTSDLTLCRDERYGPITQRFHDDVADFEETFARAWFKLTHLGMGPVERYLGQEAPQEELLWRDPVPEHEGRIVDAERIADLKQRICDADLSVGRLVRTAWASACSYRGADKRGGPNGARIQLEPQRSWAVNEPDALHEVLSALEAVRSDFNAAQSDGTQVSMADLIVLGGGVGVEQAAKAAGLAVEVPFTPGRTDATQEQTDLEAFAPLEPASDWFRSFAGPDVQRPAEFQLVDTANRLTLTTPEMTVLVGGLRVLGANVEDSATVGVFTSTVGTLSPDYFRTLLDLRTSWEPAGDDGLYRGVGPDGQELLGSRADLAFSANAELRAVAEVYACADSDAKFTRDFVRAWVKVMELDRPGLAAVRPAA